MQSCLLRSHEATDARHDELTNPLNQQLEEGTKVLWRCHEFPAASGPTRSNEIKYINIEVTEGTCEGKTYELQPKKRAACWLGRLVGKEFVEKGISFAKDDEVSTMHGKFELINGKTFFTDAGSTNGTVRNCEEFEDNVS